MNMHLVTHLWCLRDLGLLGCYAVSLVNSYQRFEGFFCPHIEGQEVALWTV